MPNLGNSDKFEAVKIVFESRELLNSDIDNLNTLSESLELKYAELKTKKDELYTYIITGGEFGVRAHEDLMNDIEKIENEIDDIFQQQSTLSNSVHRKSRELENAMNEYFISRRRD